MTATAAFTAPNYTVTVVPGTPTVRLTAAGLCTLVRLFTVDKPQTANGLCAKLDDIDGANPNAKAGKIGAFINEVNAK